MSLEKKLHQNILDIIDEFMADYNVQITKVNYNVEIHKDDDKVTFAIETDMK
jgi:hypothetical protein